MSTTAERDRKAAASQKRLDKMRDDMAALNAKTVALHEQINHEEKRLAWVKAMPVEDGPKPPRTQLTITPPTTITESGATK